MIFLARKQKDLKLENFEQVLRVLFISSFAHKGAEITYNDFAKNLGVI